MKISQHCHPLLVCRPSFSVHRYCTCGAGKENKFLRVRPLTAAGAPARGSTVRLHHQGGRAQLQVIDSGSGYLCQQEAVAHFGLGAATGPMVPVRVVVRWPDSAIVVVYAPPSNCVLTVPHPGVDAKQGDTVTVARKCIGVAQAGTVAGRVAPELGAIRASVCPSGTKTDLSIALPDAPAKPIVSLAQRRTQELRQAQVLVRWGGASVNDLHDEYLKVFPKTYNRNAASHLWSSFVLRRSMQYGSDKIRELMSGFCSVSGSIVRPVSAGGSVSSALIVVAARRIAPTFDWFWR